MSSNPSQLFQLENGLQVVISPQPRLPLAAVSLFYDVGARDEKEGQTGFAHLFEHLMFEGSEHVESGSHFSLVAGLGGRLNANTTHERTLYYASVPSNQLDVVLWMEADRMRSLKVTHESFEHQRKTVLEERKQRVDNQPFGLARERFSALCHADFSYAHPVIGSEEDIRSADLEQVQAFHQTWYRPNNAILSIAGDVDVDACMRRIEEWFSEIESGELPDFKPSLNPEWGERKKAIVAEPLARLSKIFIAHPVPSYGHSDFFALEMAETLLMRGPSSRAWQRLVLDERLAVGLAGGYTARRSSSFFSLSATVERPEVMDRVARSWQSILDDFVSGEIDEREWSKALGQIRAAHVYAQEGVLSRANSSGRYALFLGDPNWLDGYLDAIESLRPQDVQRAAAHYFLRDHRVELHAVAKGSGA